MNRHRLLIAVAVLLIAALSPRAAGQVGPALIFKPFAEKQYEQGVATDGGFDAFLFAEGDTDNAAGPDDFQLQRYEGEGRVRLKDAVAGRDLSFGFDVLHLELNTNDPALPERLHELRAAVAMTVFEEPDDWRLDVVGGAGFAGDLPYSDSDALYAMGDIIFTKTLDERSQLQFVLNYDGNRSIFPDVPLPAVAYSRQSSDTLRYTVGVPYSNITWRPFDPLTLTLDYWLPFTANIKAEYAVSDMLHVFASFENRYDAFHINGDDENRRLFFQQRRVELGVRIVPCPHGEIIVAGGYAFGQEFERGWDARDTDTIRDVSDEPFFRIGGMLRF